ncbi:hypothetical protein ACFL6S_17315 [Candidatus Poribacteria bacterium]
MPSKQMMLKTSQATVAAIRTSEDWTWLKFMLEGPNLRVKVWNANAKEPDNWDIDYEDAAHLWKEGPVGIRVRSGTALVAFYRVSDLEGADPKSVDPQEKLASRWAEIKLAK